MIPALVTSGNLLLHRISLICCACIVLACIGCFNFNIPDQNAVIDIYADKPDSSDMIKLDTTVMYDSIASTLTCILHADSFSTNQNEMPVRLFQNGKEINHCQSKKGHAELGWINGGVYSLQIGKPQEYPCILIHNLSIPSGTKCDLHIYKIPKP